MSYSKQNFVDGQVLKAEHLNHMEEGIANAGGGASSWNDLTDKPKVVVYTEQTLTEAQKAQARANIGAGEEWVQIIDLTTTEEVGSVYVTKDVNGNSFECKQIITEIVVPTNLPSVQGLAISGGDSFYAAPYWMHNFSSTITRDYTDTVIVEGAFLKGLYEGGNEPHFADTRHGGILRTAEAHTKNYKALGIHLASSFPIGTTIKAWGLKV